MKKSLLLFSVFFFQIAFMSCNEKPMPIRDVIAKGMDVAINQSKAMAESLVLNDTLLPKSFNNETGKLITSNSRWWCSGFFPGTLWYLYEYSKDSIMRTYAEKYTMRVEREKYTTNNHDVGFMLYCSFGNGLRLIQTKSYEEVLLTGSKSLSTRFSPKVGLIRSWDHHSDKWQYPVIIDNMMNLELLMWAFHHSGDSSFYRIAVSHADKTLKNHYRADNSCFHVVSYDTITGKPQVKQTHQGASDSSLWARGQAWGLYGYTMMYRETGNAIYLEQAKKIANLLINHPNMPTDFIPYWDFTASGIPNEPRDASAAAIMASALLELSSYVGNQQKHQYLSVAETQIRRLSSPEYLAGSGTNGNFIIKHNVGSKPHNSEVDVPLTYADYYYVEALTRYNNLLKFENVLN